MQTENLKLTKNLVLHGEKKTPAVKVQPNPAAISSNHFVLTRLTASLEKCNQDFASVAAFTNQMITDLVIYTHAEVGAFYLWNEELQRFAFSNFYNMGASEKITSEFLLDDDLIQSVILEKKPISITHTGDNHCTMKIGNVYADEIMVVPIFHNSSLIGLVELGHSWQKFSDETLELLTLSSQLFGMKIAELESKITIQKFSVKAIKNKNQIDAHEQNLLLHQAELYQANEELKSQITLLQETASLLAAQHEEQEKQALKLAAQTLKLRQLNEKLDIEAREKQKLAEDLVMMSEFARINVEKAKHLASLGEANEKLFSVNQEFIALNEELHKQNIEKEARAAELLIANVELAFQNREKEARAAELEEVYTAKEELRSQVNHMQKLEMIGRLTSGVAHDFNNILSCILGYNEMNYDVSNMITDSLLRAELENNLNQIDLAGHRAVSLIQKMLTYCRKETSKEKMRVIPAQQVIDEALQMLHPLLTSQIKMEFINRCLINEGDCINCDYRNNCDTRIEVDVVELHQVLMNLAVNARDAMKLRNGIITFSLQKRLNVKDFCVACGDRITGNFIEINVADNGTGISPKIINKIFDPFFTTKEQGAGTGLGLSAVSGIVHHSSGHILIDSVQTEPNHGTTFRLLFPIPPQVLD